MDGSARASIDRASSDRYRSLRRELGVTAFGVSQLVLGPGQSMRIHRHREQEELYLVLEGRLEMVVEGEPQIVGPGELVAVAPGTRRQLTNPFREPVVVLAVGGAGGHEPRDAEAFTGWDATTGAQPRDVPYPDDLPESQLRD